MAKQKKKAPTPVGKGKKPPIGGYKKGPLSLLILLVILFTVMILLQEFHRVETISWDKFTNYVNSGYVESVVIKEGEREIVGNINEAGIAAIGEDVKASFKTNYLPEWSENIGQLLKDNNVKTEVAKGRTWIVGLVSMLFPIFLFLGVFYFLFAKNMRSGAGGMLMSFGRSKHRLHSKDRVKITFKDVAGIEEAKDEVNEIIEFLKNPKKFQRLGGRIPRGVLLVGPPGCGKTLLAKAIAGEADVPFFSISGSDFVEMFVGVGASRVRDLFKQAKDNSPCIIFLDEIDAIGRKRGAGYAGGGHDEREQTLNAILVEMDGFDTNDQVIVVAATNRGDILDSALTRPGRFDRQVVVPLPDLKGRMEILRVHATRVKLDPKANLERVARGTPMFSGADLAAIINEAALAATMANKDHVETADLEEARDKVRWGRAKRSRVVDEHDKKITAYHEAGHAIVQAMLDDADPLHKVSIIPRGPMGGATFSLPEKDRLYYSRNYCLAEMKVAFGGRIAEEMFCGDISSGAQSDIQQATRIARQMVQTWGMSDELGPISYVSNVSMEEYMYATPGEKDYSERTAESIDSEIRKLCDKTYAGSKQLILENKDKLDKIAKALLRYETLDAEDVKIILQGGELDKPTVTDLIAAEQAKSGEKTVAPDVGWVEPAKDDESKDTE